MARKRISPEQIITNLREAEVLLANGQDGGRIFGHPGESIDNPARYMSPVFRNVLDWVE